MLLHVLSARNCGDSRQGVEDGGGTAGRSVPCLLFVEIDELRRSQRQRVIEGEDLGSDKGAYDVVER